MQAAEESKRAAALQRVPTAMATGDYGALGTEPSTAPVVAAIWWWWERRQHQSTDDAQIDGYIYPVSTRIRGQIARVHVDDGQFVKAGTVLAEIDARDYETTLARARSQQQASVLSYADTLWIMAIFCFVAIPLIFIARRPPAGHATAH